MVLYNAQLDEESSFIFFRLKLLLCYYNSKTYNCSKLNYMMHLKFFGTKLTK